MNEKADSLLPSGRMTEGQGEELQSGTIALMRVPLVVAVIFIHSIGMPEYVQPYWDSFTGMDVFNWLRVCFSLVLPKAAVGDIIPPENFNRLSVHLGTAYHLSSDLSSGMHGFRAAIAISIMLSSGSFVVSRCMASPGAESIRVKRLS